MTHQRAWSTEELLQAEEEVGLAPARSNPMPRVAPNGVIAFETEVWDSGSRMPWYGRLGIAAGVFFFVGWTLIGVTESHGRHPHALEPWQLIGIILAAPGTVAAVGGLVLGVCWWLRWVVTGR